MLFHFIHLIHLKQPPRASAPLSVATADVVADATPVVPALGEAPGPVLANLARLAAEAADPAKHDQRAATVWAASQTAAGALAIAAPAILRVRMQLLLLFVVWALNVLPLLSMACSTAFWCT